MNPFESCGRIGIPDRVVDAGVLGSLIFAEARSAEARDLLRGCVLHGPTLLPYELGAIARRKIQLHPEERDSLLDCLKTGLSLDMKLHEPAFRELTALALDRGLSLQDAAYIWTARALDATLVTFDEKLLNHPETRPHRKASANHV